ncbi:TetR/AcrR family transcriptional regulator [Haliangium ochraceum]|uniref:Transcriptional regulator, TetR family n=1 Tax=Haliangium ochraceum (strain DSM 14365 / JCM 11303 / SMP-2) TaxID=502025 RepID=D0LSP6_HALO1|nr:TetR/AcrR family transcriptional regulator [Haliangium ochraceum]ACY17268.1 transcriptional regulator, TetR family [Haliangium ochraceum DSM 14365]
MGEKPTPRTRAQRRQAREDTRERLVRAGLAAVLESGWAATGVDKIVRAAEVPKGSFYHYFPSKDAFGLALLDSYQAYFLERLQRCFGQPDQEAPSTAAPSLAQQLQAFLRESVAGMRRHRWRRGCLIGALGQELGGLKPAFRTRLDASLAAWEQRLAAAIGAAQERGEVAADADPARLARSFWAAWEGAVLRARLARSSDPLVLVIEDFDHLIHRPHRRDRTNHADR